LDTHTIAATAVGAPALAGILDLQRQAHRADPAPGCERRLDRLDRLARINEQHCDDIAAAICADFGHRSTQETLLSEVLMVGAAIRNARRHLRAWMKPRRVATPLHYLPASNRLMRQPLGVVGVVSPWNYPYQLAIGPAVGAIAAGNRVMIKPSELTPRFSELLDRLVASHFSAEEVKVVQGDADLARAFVALPFDHLLFTGSTAVGREVAQVAARNLTPVTLELGGKSPALIDASCDFAVAAPRIAFGKWLNAGQTCIAPDYLLVPRGRAHALADSLAAAVGKLYPSIAGNADYSSIVSDRHMQRLCGLLADAVRQGATLRPLGQHAPAERKLAPTLVLGATRSMLVMREEIFGPVLPIVEYESLGDAIEFINAGERPLALYWFGSDRANRERVLAQTLSGGATVNDCLWHFAQEGQPFGGVGASGVGAYHGEWGFRTFSKEKPVFLQSRLNGIGLLHPPYGKTFDRMLSLLKRIA
jgi:coniferyl-aldehyde dehydrogenase